MSLTTSSRCTLKHNWTTCMLEAYSFFLNTFHHFTCFKQQNSIINISYTKKIAEKTHPIFPLIKVQWNNFRVQLIQLNQIIYILKIYLWLILSPIPLISIVEIWGSNIYCFIMLRICMILCTNIIYIFSIADLLLVELKGRRRQLRPIIVLKRK